MLLGVAAVPDAVYQLSRNVHAQAYRRGVVLLPYSLAVPYALSLMILIGRFGGALDTSNVKAALAKVEETLAQLDDSLESHMSRGLTMLTNAVQNQRSGIIACKSTVAALRAREEQGSVLRCARRERYARPRSAAPAAARDPARGVRGAGR